MTEYTEYKMTPHWDTILKMPSEGKNLIQAIMIFFGVMVQFEEYFAKFFACVAVPCGISAAYYVDFDPDDLGFAMLYAALYAAFYFIGMWAAWKTVFLCMILYAEGANLWWNRGNMVASLFWQIVAAPRAIKNGIVFTCRHLRRALVLAAGVGGIAAGHMRTMTMTAVSLAPSRAAATGAITRLGSRVANYLRRKLIPDMPDLPNIWAILADLVAAFTPTPAPTPPAAPNPFEIEAKRLRAQLASTENALAKLAAHTEAKDRAKRAQIRVLWKRIHEDRAIKKAKDEQLRIARIEMHAAVRAGEARLDAATRASNKIIGDLSEKIRVVTEAHDKTTAAAQKAATAAAAELRAKLAAAKQTAARATKKAVVRAARLAVARAAKKAAIAAKTTRVVVRSVATQTNEPSLSISTVDSLTVDPADLAIRPAPKQVDELVPTGAQLVAAQPCVVAEVERGPSFATIRSMVIEAEDPAPMGARIAEAHKSVLEADADTAAPPLTIRCVDKTTTDQLASNGAQLPEALTSALAIETEEAAQSPLIRLGATQVEESVPTGARLGHEAHTSVLAAGAESAASFPFHIRPAVMAVILAVVISKQVDELAPTRVQLPEAHRGYLEAEVGTALPEVSSAATQTDATTETDVSRPHIRFAATQTDEPEPTGARLAEAHTGVLVPGAEASPPETRSAAIQTDDPEPIGARMTTTEPDISRPLIRSVATQTDEPEPTGARLAETHKGVLELGADTTATPLPIRPDDIQVEEPEPTGAWLSEAQQCALRTEVERQAREMADAMSDRMRTDLETELGTRTEALERKYDALRAEFLAVYEAEKARLVAQGVEYKNSLRAEFDDEMESRDRQWTAAKESLRRDYDARWVALTREGEDYKATLMRGDAERTAVLARELAAAKAANDRDLAAAKAALQREAAEKNARFVLATEVEARARRMAQVEVDRERAAMAKDLEAAKAAMTIEYDEMLEMTVESEKAVIEEKYQGMVAEAQGESNADKVRAELDNQWKGRFEKVRADAQRTIEGLTLTLERKKKDIEGQDGCVQSLRAQVKVLQEQIKAPQTMGPGQAPQTMGPGQAPQTTGPVQADLAELRRQVGRLENELREKDKSVAGLEWAIRSGTGESLLVGKLAQQNAEMGESIEYDRSILLRQECQIADLQAMIKSQREATQTRIGELEAQVEQLQGGGADSEDESDENGEEEGEETGSEMSEEE